MKTLSTIACPRGVNRVNLPTTLVGSLVVVLLVACASVAPPTEAVAVSTSAVTQARAAGATELAPIEMNMARDKLDRANLAMGDKNYDRALMLAQEAEVDARLAEAKSQSAKAKKAADDVQENIRVLREEIDRKNK